MQKLVKAWDHVYPYSERNRRERQRKYREASFAEHILKPASVAPIQCNGAPIEGLRVASSASDPAPFFARLPFELRRCILVHAFGNRTLHMDLGFLRPPQLVDKKPTDPTQPAHARIEPWSIAHPNDYRTQEWRWRGCVCHRSCPEEDPLSLGRLRTDPCKYFRGSGADGCLLGEGACTTWPGEWPEKCQIGIMGWLLSCRQAYIEGMDVLYGTNTIQISSDLLLRGMQDVLSSTVLSHIKSLELVWNPQDLHIKKIFEGLQPEQDRKHTSPFLPSLKHLRICLSSLEYVITGVTQADGMQLRGIDFLASHMPRSLDSVLVKIAPPTADVTVTCQSYEWFRRVHSALVESLGRERAQLHQSEFGGPKFWRCISSEKEEGDTDTGPTSNPVDQAQNSTRAQGYWIHLEIGTIKYGVHPEEDWYNW